jgi:hypothetical protein
MDMHKLVLEVINKYSKKDIMTDDQIKKLLPKPECTKKGCSDLGYDHEADLYIKRYGYKNLKEDKEIQYGLKDYNSKDKIDPKIDPKLNVGLHLTVPDSQFDKKQLKRGIEVEKEHTTNPKISKEIAKDHLSELSDYYTRLDKMEKEGNKYFSKLFNKDKKENE